jgi:uncharacterized phage protein (TIGR01671 family)
MREIEFRVWDKELNRFNSPNVHHLRKSDGVVKVILDSPIVKIAGNDRFVIQQYTGLLDKNGKKIYEGDIVRHGGTAEHVESVVGFNPPSFVCRVFYFSRNDSWRRGEENWVTIWDRKGVEAFNNGYYRCNMTMHDHYEVIGNIFENADLL